MSPVSVNHPSQIVEYNADWPTQFAEEEVRLRAGMPGAVLSFEHVGSTAVAGLPGKPVVDILMLLDHSPLTFDERDKLAILGYGEVMERPDGSAMFVHLNPDFTLHISQPGYGHATELVTFRDQLRADPRLRDFYGELKRLLARMYSGDLVAYTKAKAPFVEQVTSRALADAEANPAG